MPRIIIREYDNTKAGSVEYSNFTVVVPGFVSDSLAEAGAWDTNNVLLLSSEADFTSYIGDVTDKTISYTIGEGETAITYNATSCGNKIAKRLLELGYKVYFLKLGKESDTTGELSIFEESTWAPLTDKGIYDFRYIMTGLIESDCYIPENLAAGVAKYINSKEEISDPTTYGTTGRGDCIALCEIPEIASYNPSANAPKTTKEIAKAIRAQTALITNADKYSAFFAPSIIYANDGTTTGEAAAKFPAAYHYLACAAKSMESYAEWYAVSGYQRGICDQSIDAPVKIFGDALVNALQPRSNYVIDTVTEEGETKNIIVNQAVNLIVKQPSGYYLWGNRTAATLDTASPDDSLKASHFLNIRQLCTTIKKQLYISCRSFMFDPNSDVLWINFKNSIIPTLEKMKADQGIKDYKITKVADDRKALLKAKIRIVPIEAVEDFDISLFLEDSISGEIDVDEAE